MSEVHQCDWNKKGSQYSVWLIAHPELLAQGPSIEDCEDKLEDIVDEALGDILPVFEYVRELPDDLYPAQFADSNYVFLTPRGAADLAAPIQNYFTTELCQVCKDLPTTRNQNPLVIETIQIDGDYLYVDYSHLVIVSERLKTALSLEKYFTVRPVILPDKYRRKFFEIQPKSAEQVFNSCAVTGPQADWLGEYKGTKCDACGQCDNLYLAGTFFNVVFKGQYSWDRVKWQVPWGYQYYDFSDDNLGFTVLAGKINLTGVFLFEEIDSRASASVSDRTAILLKIMQQRYPYLSQQHPWVNSLAPADPYANFYRQEKAANE